MNPQEVFGGMIPVTLIPVIIALALWTVFWKGLAFWHSARRGDVVWFCLFLVVNTAGILEIIYLFAFAKRSFNTLFSK